MSSFVGDSRFDPIVLSDSDSESSSSSSSAGSSSSSTSSSSSCSSLEWNSVPPLEHDNLDIEVCAFFEDKAGDASNLRDRDVEITSSTLNQQSSVSASQPSRPSHISQQTKKRTLSQALLGHHELHIVPGFSHSSHQVELDLQFAHQLASGCFKSKKQKKRLKKLLRKQRNRLMQPQQPKQPKQPKLPRPQSSSASVNTDSNDESGASYFGLCDLLGFHEPTSKEWLMIKNILMVDLDNWQSFFSKLPGILPENVFVWAFWGGATNPKVPRDCRPVQALLEKRCLQFTKCGISKNSADFALTLKLGEMHQRLPKTVPITIVSGDKGFHELEKHLIPRKLILVNPHHLDPHVLFALLRSVSEM